VAPRVRAAQPDDAAAIAEVHVETWRGAYAHAVPAEYLASLDVARRARWWRSEIETGADVLVAEDDGKVVGFASVGAARDEPESVGELYAIYVRPAAWGTGAGRALIDAAHARMHERGYRDAILWVLENNPRARRFYEIAGWSTDGGRKIETIGGAEIAEARYRRVLGDSPLT
jgi:GNAT superfamily N-acetyltransferase